MRPRLYAATHLCLGLCLASTALAQHGASDERVSLPEGPGSLEGVGDNAVINGNMGSMQYAVPIEVPAGFPAVTPNLAMAYDSSGPAGVMGIGWDLSVPFVERMTNWGLPEYTLDDDFVAGGQLVHVGDGVYRNRFEKGFARHTWHDRGDGTQGYWTSELPDGTVQYFGADAAGNLVDSARVAGRAGATFRYHLVEQVDKFGHAMRFDYTTYDGLPHLDRISYIFTGGDGGPGASLRFEYADRPDVLTDARSGATERRTQRLVAVNVFSKAVRIWRYMVEYEDEALSNGLSRVQRIHRVGLDDTPHPVAFDFEYSRTFGNECAADCDQPYLVSMGSIGVNLAAGDATLADMNGDGLPDIIDTSREGAHRIFVNRYQARDSHAFELPVDSATGDRAGHQLSSPYVQTLDANGDGRVDLVNVRTGQVLYNLGDGDWSEASALGDTGSLPDFGDDFPGGDEQPTHIRFFDYDNDRRIDVLRSTAFETTIYANQGDAGFAVVEDVDAIQASFEGGLELADMNGDGLQDAVFLRPGSLSYRANLGWGRWSAWYEIENLPFNEAEQPFVELQDINGDSLDDLVIVLGDELRFALNRAGTHFDRVRTINEAGGQALPVRVDGTTVLFADMNGSGSDDVVWLSPQGDVTYLELFPIRPNLLTRLTNGLGVTSEISYVTLAEAQARSAAAWTWSLPFAMTVVDSIDTYDLLNEQHRRQAFVYESAYYDGEEKAYRGFETVTTLTPGDAYQEGRARVETFDLGVEDRYRAGLLLAAADYAIEADGAWAPLGAIDETWEDCPVAELPAGDLARPIRFVCRTATDGLVQERAPEADWVRVRATYAYDGYGNLTDEANLGVVGIGDGGCPACDRAADEYGAPCGEMCTGDELYRWSTYTRADDRWILGLPVRISRAMAADSPDAAVTEYFYDGEPFVGRPAGQADLGQLHRSRAAVGADSWVALARNRYDDHGNLIEALDPRGAVGDDALLTRYAYDDEHLLRTLVSIDAGDHRVETRSSYEAIWGLVEETVGPQVVVDGEAVTPDNRRRYVYDAISNLVSQSRPGDPANRPSIEFDFDYGAPVSRIETRRRIVQGAASADHVSVVCRDGFGRGIAQLVATGPDAVEVGGYSVVNTRGASVLSYPAAVTDSDNCLIDDLPTRPTTSRYDALGRLISRVRDDAAIHGTASESRSVFTPQVRAHYFPDDLDPASPGVDTPVVETRDGLGRIVSVHMREAADAEELEWRTTYDVRGAVRRIVDPAGDARVFTRDRLGRIVESVTPDHGLVRFEYDAAGNPVRREDAAGRVERRTYDGLNRMTAAWDEADRPGTLVENLYDRPDHCPDDRCPTGANQRVGVRFPTPEGRGARWITHDLRGRLVAIRTEIDGLNLDEAFAYDNLDRLVESTRPDGSVERRTVDAIGRTTAIDGIASLTWARGGLLASERLENGLTVTHAHDLAERPTALMVRGGSGTLLDLAYGHDRRGNLIAIDDATAPDDAPGRSMRLSFDGLNRLIGAHLDPGRADFEEVLTYRYDRAMNLVSKRSSLGAASPSHVGALDYDGAQPHAVTAAGARSYGYDAAGLMTDRDGATLTWNAAGRPVSVEQDGATVARYWYADERIVARTRTTEHLLVSPEFVIEDGIALSHTYLGMRRIATRESDALAAQVLGDLAPVVDGESTADGVFDTGDAVVAAQIDAGTLAAPDGVRRAELRAMLRGQVRSRLLAGAPRVTFAHHDATRNLVLETDADGAVIARHAPDPHGLDRKSSPARGFEGRMIDAAAGLVHMGARAFDPWLARWISPDPAFALAQAGIEFSSPIEANNLYGFAQDNPLRFTDPSGYLGQTARQLDTFGSVGTINIGDLARGTLSADEAVVFAYDAGYDDIVDKVNDLVALGEQLEAAQDAVATARLVQEIAAQTVAEATGDQVAGAQAALDNANAELANARAALAANDAFPDVADFRKVKAQVMRNIARIDVAVGLAKQGVPRNAAAVGFRIAQARQSAEADAARFNGAPNAAPKPNRLRRKIAKVKAGLSAFSKIINKGARR